MNTISTTASTKTILAIDLGKYKSVVCLLDPDTGEYRFTTFETTRSAVRQLLDKERPAVVIIEACLLAGLLAPHLYDGPGSEARPPESRLDALTGLPNRRAFTVRLGAEVARVRRHGGHLALCLVDVDGFQ